MILMGRFFPRFISNEIIIDRFAVFNCNVYISNIHVNVHEKYFVILTVSQFILGCDRSFLTCEGSLIRE